MPGFPPCSVQGKDLHQERARPALPAAKLCTSNETHYQYQTPQTAHSKKEDVEKGSAYERFRFITANNAIDFGRKE
jgi:hypothetical protein